MKINNGLIVYGKRATPVTPFSKAIFESDLSKEEKISVLSVCEYMTPSEQREYLNNI